jgi:hypothetical protein
MSRVPSYILGLKYQTPAFHRLRSAPDETTLIRDFRIAGLAATTEGSLPYGSRFLGASTVYICFHDRIKGHLRRHLFEQVKSWSIVGQGMFQLREINQMEREMCQYLDWELNVEPSTLKEFEAMVRKDFAGPGPYPTYVLQTISKLAASSTNPFPAIAPNSSTSPIPSFGPRQASPPKSTPPPPSIPINPAKAYLTPHARYT